MVSVYLGVCWKNMYVSEVSNKYLRLFFPLMNLIPNKVSVYTLPRNLRLLNSDWCVLNRCDNGCDMLQTAIWFFVDTIFFALSIPMPHIRASFLALVFGSLRNEVKFAKDEAILDTALVRFLSITTILALVTTAFKCSFR